MAEFTIKLEPAHDRMDLLGIAERLDQPMAGDALAVWYRRDVRALLERVLELERELRLLRAARPRR